MTTETRTYLGEIAAGVDDNWLGFRVGQRYELQITRRKDGNVAIEPIPVGEGIRLLVVTPEQWEKWFSK
ncbi:hypothetical protein FNT36_03320 [Hymenobacter setariae]|uniref:Uncharacterized protein n=1 Tax=Hymenobacter setariae TaxID=2594794 RepID=A0A558C373_9BACT|nr:hypothetical protein [Hymenobacter setariae]TVT43137.1 hypothetical protein FNT36_03320 [Hymenobacter setariae]